MQTAVDGSLCKKIDKNGDGWVSVTEMIDHLRDEHYPESHVREVLGRIFRSQRFIRLWACQRSLHEIFESLERLKTRSGSGSSGGATWELARLQQSISQIEMRLRQIEEKIAFDRRDLKQHDDLFQNDIASIRRDIGELRHVVGPPSAPLVSTTTPHVGAHRFLGNEERRDAIAPTAPVAPTAPDMGRPLDVQEATLSAMPPAPPAP